MKSETIGKLVEALSKAQGQIKTAGKTGRNPRFQSTYSTVEDIWNSCRRPLSENGLAVTQTTDSNDSGNYLITTLMHSSGEWIDSKMPLFLPKLDSQMYGSAITYAKKYSLAAMLGIASGEDDVNDQEKDTDDDGEGCRAQDGYKSKKTIEFNTITKDKALEVKEFLNTNTKAAVNCKTLLKAQGIDDLGKIPMALYAKLRVVMATKKETPKAVEV